MTINDLSIPVVIPVVIPVAISDGLSNWDSISSLFPPRCSLHSLDTVPVFWISALDSFDALHVVNEQVVEVDPLDTL